MAERFHYASFLVVVFFNNGCIEVTSRQLCVVVRCVKIKYKNLLENHFS